MMPVHDHLAGLSADDEQRLGEIVEAFEVAWNEGPLPRIAEYLPTDEPFRHAVLVELVYIDQENAIRSESPRRLEAYLDQFPELKVDPEVLCEIVVRDFAMRGSQGESPLTEEYLGRFPDLGERLELRLKAESPRPRSPNGSTLREEAAGQSAEIPIALPSEKDRRYDQIEFHARGGLGDVYRAREVGLSREVALKKIRREFASLSKVRLRFLREARLTAKLNHKGVVPIHGLIYDRHDQPWYVMRFVEGITLERAISDHHAGSILDDRPLAFRNLLVRFVAVCNTLAYAHSRSVVHRDLKPANVIVGDYDETVVLDWGLATSTSAPPDGEESQSSAPARMIVGPEGPLTAFGQVLGTPAFMSPEQAKGLPSMNLPSSDIYGLGAILYMILTGQAPFQPQAWHSLQEKIVRGEYPAPRQLRPEIPRELEAICLKAMDVDPARRYETAEDLARDIGLWEIGEPVSAYPEPRLRRARRWASKHKTGLGTASGAAAGIILLLGLAYGAWAAEVRKADASALARLVKVEDLAIEARSSGDPTAWDKALAEGFRALERVEAAGSAEVRGRVDARLGLLRAERARLVEDLAARERDTRVVAELDEARLRRSNLKGNDFDKDATHAAYLAAFVGYGIDLATLTTEEAASRIRSSRVAADLIASLDDWSRFKSNNVPKEKLVEIARLAESRSGPTPIADALASADPATLRLLCEREEGRKRLGPRFRSVFNAMLERDPSGSFPVLEAVRRERPADFWLNLDLGLAYKNAKPPRLPDALRCHTAAVAIRPASPGAHLTLGNVFLAGEDFEESIAEYRLALELDPRSALVHSNLAHTLISSGDIDGAVIESRLALELDPDYGEAHNNLGVALEKRGVIAEAAKEFREALRINPSNRRAHSNLGHALYLLNDFDGSIAECQLALELDPEVSDTHNNLGVALKARGDAKGAFAEFQAAIRIDPENSDAHINLGLALRGRGDIAGAIAEYQMALRFDPSSQVARNNLVQALVVKGDFDGAIAQCRLLIEDHPDYAEGHNSFGVALKAKGDLDGAVDECKLAVQLDPKFAEGHCFLGMIERGRGRHSEALAHFTRGHEIGSKQPGWAYKSADWVADSRRMVDLEARLPALLKGEDSPRDLAERIFLADACLKEGRNLAASRWYAEAFAERPSLAADLAKGTRYNAAFASVLAASGLGKDASPTDDAARAELRARALTWLRADLEAWAKVLEAGNRKAVAQSLAHWLEDPDLAGIRDESALAKLPEAEREACRALWLEVDALRKKAGP